MPIVAPTFPDDRIEISDVRDQVKLIMEAALSGPVRIHAGWKLKVDIGKIVALLRSDKDDVNSPIRAWMCGTNSFVNSTNQSGGLPFVGSSATDRTFKIDIWGFFDETMKNADGLSAMTLAERETELIADWIKRQGNTLGFDMKPSELKQVAPMQMDNLETHSFSEGYELVISQNSLLVTLRR